MPRKPGGQGGQRPRPKGKRLGFRRPLRWLRYAVLAFVAASVLGALCFRFVPVPVTPLMLIRLGEQRAEGHPMRLEKTWRALERISPSLQEAVVASEDQRFFEHHGFDWDAIGSAFTSNGRGRRKLGASTISQQTAKNLFLWPDRTWLRKGLEAYFTVLIETLWPKRRILEVYLNIIETGDGIYGAEAASRRYYQRPAADMAASQAALLAASLPNPRAWSPARPTGYLLRRQTWILRQMDHLGPVPWDASPGGGSRPGPSSRPSTRPPERSSDRPSRNQSDRPSDGNPADPAPSIPPAIPPGNAEDTSADPGDAPTPGLEPPQPPAPAPEGGVRFPPKTIPRRNDLTPVPGKIMQTLRPGYATNPGCERIGSQECEQ
jgi:monofunctional glycosyltransferase